MDIWKPNNLAINTKMFELNRFLNDPCYEKTGFLHMRKQRRRSASR